MGRAGAPGAGRRPDIRRRAAASSHAADVFRDDAHADAAKSCDACHAPGACDVEVVLDHAAKVLVLSLAVVLDDHNGNDVAALLELVWRENALAAKRVFVAQMIKFELGLFAVAVFQNAYTAASASKSDGSDSWTHHDRRSAVRSDRSRMPPVPRRGDAVMPCSSPHRIYPPLAAPGLAAEEDEVRSVLRVLQTLFLR